MTTDPRHGRSLAWACAGVATLSTLAWVVGLDWLSAVLIGTALVLCLGLSRFREPASGRQCPLDDDEAADRGTRREVSQLSWTLHSFGVWVERSAVLRLQTVAATRLSRLGLDPATAVHAERIRALVGDSAYGVLAAGPEVRVAADNFSAAVASVERLDREPAS